MSYRQFVVPAARVIADELGIEPIPGADPGVGTLHFGDARAGERLELTYDVLGRSVRCRWRRGDEVLWDVYREGATSLAVVRSGERASVNVTFEVDGAAGQLRIAVAPAFAVRDELLFH